MRLHRQAGTLILQVLLQGLGKSLGELSSLGGKLRKKQELQRARILEPGMVILTYLGYL